MSHEINLLDPGNPLSYQKNLQKNSCSLNANFVSFPTPLPEPKETKFEKKSNKQKWFFIIYFIKAVYIYKE